MVGEHIVETAVALASDDGKTFYAVQMFGRPASAKFKIEITNQTDTKQVLHFRTEDSRGEVTIPPRTMLSLSRCMVTSISLEPSKDRITVKESGQFAITSTADSKIVLKAL